MSYIEPTGSRLVVQGGVNVGIKLVAEITALRKKQLLTYPRLADKRLGLSIKFQRSLIKDGITRIVVLNRPML